jgi:hypothetical protein
MEQVCLVTFTKPWDMTDAQTGERRKGITIEYLLSTDLKPVEGMDNSRGVRHCKESLPLEKLSKIKDVPGFYNCSFSFAPGSKGKVVTKLSDIDFVSIISNSEKPLKV